MFHSLGLFAYRRRYLVIAAWIVVLCASVPLLCNLHSVLHGGGFANGTSESDRALALLQSDLRYYPSAVTIIFSDKRLHVGEPAFKSDMERALAGLRELPHLARIDTYDGPHGSSAMVSPDRHATYAVLNFTAPLESTEAVLRRLYAHLHTRRLHAIVTGAPVVYADMERLSTQDLAQVEKFTFPVALALLVVIFGTLVASGVPLLIGGVSVATTLALLDLLGHVTRMSTFALNVTTMIGLGIGIDYALLMVSRFREEIARRPIEEAVAVTVAQAGRAVLFSGGTGMLGLSGLLMFKATALRSMGVGGALVVLVAVLAALTLVPAVLGVLGPRIDALAVLPHRDSGARFWPAVARAVMRRPWPVIALTLLAVGAIASPVRELKLSIPDATILPQSVRSRQGFDMLQKTFRVNADSPILPVVYGSGPILQPRYLAAPLGAGLHRAIGGYTPGAMDYINALYSDFPKAILFVIGSIFVVLLVLFRSVVLPLKAVLMNILSLL